jgi:hypothetical protein
VLASAVRTDRGCFRAVAMDAPLVIRLRELARAEAVVTDEVVAVTNRLRDLIQRIAPAWLTMSTNADDPWFWSLLELVATPQLGRGLRRRVLTALLERHRIRKWDVDAVFAALEVEPLPVAPGTVEAVTAHIRLLLPRVQLLAEQQKACRRGLEALLDEYAASDDTAVPPSTPPGPTPGTPSTPPAPDDVTILRSLPGVGTLITATLLTDAGSALAARDYLTLRATAGIAPVRRQTGKNKRGTITMRRACNRRLRHACYHWANGSQRLDAAAKAYYATLRQRGQTHGRALRSLADRWLRILMAMLKTRTLYDARRFAPTTTV